MENQKQQNISPPKVWNGHEFKENPRPAEPWLQGRGFAPIAPKNSFFVPESKKQRVVVMEASAYGQTGRGVMLKMKDAAGVKFEKPATCWCDLDLMDPDTMRRYRWEVTSLPAYQRIRELIERAGPDFPGKLTVDIWTVGRSTSKVFNIDPVDQDDSQVDEDPESTPESSTSDEEAEA